MMCMRIKGVVDRNALLSTQGLVRVNDRIAPAICQDEIILGYQRQEWVIGVVVYAIERRRSVDVPKDLECVTRSHIENALFQQLIKGPDAAGLDDHIGVA